MNRQDNISFCQIDSAVYKYMRMCIYYYKYRVRKKRENQVMAFFFLFTTAQTSNIKAV